uniref:hypothetical protein n=1 Tax=Lactobacillus delbrueckii TaxID=1584 RepID=UPI0021A7DB44|nr:hypothetical protein [Lactobacillus delbrueckii]
MQEQRLVEKDGHLTLPVKSSFKKAIAGRIIAYSANGQTAFILPRKLDQLSSEKIAVKGQIEAIEAMILGQLTAAVYEESPGLLRNIDVVAAIDQIICPNAGLPGLQCPAHLLWQPGPGTADPKLPAADPARACPAYIQ